MPKNALVTGGSGFIGSHLVEALLEKGFHVRCLLRKTSDLRWINHLPIEKVFGDCLNKESLIPVVKNIDMVFHLAGLTKAKKAQDFFRFNVGGTENLASACLEHNDGLNRFVYVSSQAAGGPWEKGPGKNENDPSLPVCLYGKSKKMAEDKLFDLQKKLPLVILRPCAIYGPRDAGMLKIFKLIARRIKFSIAGMDQRFSLCYIQDLIDAIMLAGEGSKGIGEFFFISDGKQYTMEQIGDAFSSVMQVKAIRLRIPKSFIIGLAWFSENLSKILGKTSNFGCDKARQLLQENWVCDIAKAKTLLKFNPCFDLQKGSRITVDWYRRENWL